MSHDTHNTDNGRPGSSLTSSVWFMLIVAGLFIAAVNFVSVMSHDDGGHGTEHADHSAPAHHDDATEHHDDHHEEGEHHEAHH